MAFIREFFTLNRHPFLFALERIVPLNVPHIVNTLRITGLALVFRSLIELVLAIAVFPALEVFEVNSARLIEAMEQ